MNPAISVVMPLYNKEKEVSRAISSVLAQTVSDFELIVVNDGSTDGGGDMVRAFADKRVRLIEQSNSGVSAARNRGIAEARANLIAFLDADDEWANNYLETILRLLHELPDASVFATGYTFKQKGGHERPAVIRGLPESFSEGIMGNYFTVAAKSDPPLWTSAVAVRREAIEGVGGFPVGVMSGEDLLTWARLSAHYRIAYSRQPKAYFWEPPVNAAERPGRIPVVPDLVGEGLNDLRDSAVMGSITGLERYIALWHTMRAAIYIQLMDNRSARTELLRAFHFNGLNIKWIVFFLLSMLPGATGKFLYTFGQRMRA